MSNTPKQLCFKYNDTDYCLEFTRKSVETLEKSGFVASDVKDKPITTIPTLFAGAFLAHHRRTDRKLIDEIYNKMPNKDALIEKLSDMYNDTIITLVEEPDESEGNIEWTATW